MQDNRYSHVDPKNGNITWDGPPTLAKGSHDHMPPRTAAYLPGDEKGHVNASSLNGPNTVQNVAPQNTDVNHKGWYAMEAGERNALKNHASIQSEKTAIVDGKPGDRPHTFMANDTITYPDGRTQNVHLEVANEFYAVQDSWNNASAGIFNDGSYPNPGDGLRASMDSNSYAALMEATDAELPGIEAEYTPADYSGPPVSGIGAETAAGAPDLGGAPDTGGTPDSGPDGGPDDGPDGGPDDGPDGGADPDPD